MEKDVVFTFDDGLKSVRTWWERFKIPATIFVLPGFAEYQITGYNLDGQYPPSWLGKSKAAFSHILTWNDCKFLLDHGCEIGCHTWRHEDVEGRTVKAVEDDLSRCKETFWRRLNLDVKLFAYPMQRLAHLATVQKYFPRVRKIVHRRLTFHISGTTVFIWHKGDVKELKKYSHEVDASRFRLLGSYSPESGVFEHVR